MTGLKYILSLLIWICFQHAISAQAETEIYLFDLRQKDGLYVLENPRNITSQNPGYDNQPHFRPNGEKLLYSSTRNGQTDVAELELREYSWAWITRTEGSEYSPTPIPGSEDFSGIRLEKDGTQLLWRYHYDLSKPSVLVPGLKVGYHCWFNENVVVAFVLGEPPTLQACYLKEGENRILQSNVGRSLHKIPGKPLVSYVSKEEDDWWIKSLDPVSGSTEKIAKTLKGAEDMAWTPDGTIFMGQDEKLFRYHPKKDRNWSVMASLKEYGLRGITRLAVSPLGNKIAVVVEQ